MLNEEQSYEKKFYSVIAKKIIAVLEERNCKAFYAQTSIICKLPLYGEQIR